MEIHGVLPQHPPQDLAKGTDRTTIYQRLFDGADCPLDKTMLPSFASLFFEPFYQLMPSAVSRHEMEKARELQADIVSLLHVAPSHNRDFGSDIPHSDGLGDTATGVWKRLARPPDRFQSVGTEDLFAPLLQAARRNGDWAGYLAQRYRWATDTAAASDA